MNSLRLTYVPTKNELKANNAIIDYGLFLTHILPVSKELKKIGANTAFFSAGKEIIQNEEIDSFKVYRTTLKQMPFFMPYGLGLSNRITKLKKMGEIDLIHSHNPAYAYYFGLNKSALQNRPLFITWHGFFPYKEKSFSFAHDYLLKKLAKFSYFLPINEPSVNQLTELGVSKDRIRLVTTGVDLDKIHEIKKKRTYFLFVGRLVGWKNVSTAIKAFNIVKDKVGGAEFIIAGEGNQFNELKELVKTLNLENKVKFFGSVDPSKLSVLYSGAIALIVPHLYDSFGKIIIEALATKTKVIATDDDIPLDLKDFVDLIPVKKAKDEYILSKKMILAYETRKNEKQKKGQVVVQKNYSWKNSAQKIKAFYDEVL